MDTKFRWYVVGLIALVLTIYGRTFFYDFTNWDDEKQIVRNDEVLAPVSLENTKTIFGTDYFVQSMYQPLTTTSFNLEHKLFGLNASGYHGINLLWHFINIGLVFWLFQLLLDKRYFSLFAAGVFAIHPLSVEVVAWISARSTLMYSTFFLAGLIAYILYVKKGLKWSYLWLSFTCFVIALFSKSMAVTLPAVLLLVDYLLRRTWSWRWLIEKIPFGLVGLFFVWVTLKGRSEFITRAGQNSDFGMVDAIFFVPYQIMWYLVKFFIPSNLSILYRDPSSLNVYHYAAPLVLGILLYILYTRFKNNREVIFGALLFLVPILPVIKLNPIGFSLVADRYLYISGLGILFLLGYFFSKVKFKKPESYKPYAFAAGVLLTLFSLQSFSRVSVWENSTTLWSNTDGDFANKWLNSGLDKKKMARKLEAEEGLEASRELYEAAIADFDKAIESYSKYWKAYYNRANCKIRLKDFSSGMEDYTKAIDHVTEDDRKNPRKQKDLAKLYYARGYFNFTRYKKYHEALDDFNNALAMDPEHANAIKFKQRLLAKMNLNLPGS